jgi:predicted deacylase
MALAVTNIMRHLQMIDGIAEPPMRQYVVRQGHWLRPRSGGLLFPRVRPLQRVRAGQITHVLTDLLGHPRERLRAPVDGMVVGVRTLGAVNSGEYCGNVGELEGDES